MALRNWKAENTTPLQEQQERIANKVAHQAATARTLAQVAGVNVYVDSGFRVWGIKTFTLREFEFLEQLLREAILTIPTYDCVKSRVMWSAFIQKCLVCHDERPGLKITIRRKLGLYDYSINAIYKYIVKTVPPMIVNDIIKANFEYDSIIEFLDPPKKNDVADIPCSWGDLVGSYLHHKGILPDELLNMTMPQLNSMNEVMKKESNDEHRDRRLEEYMRLYGMKRG
jgi:hypothetical protein